jgi:uncharacterized glyoxalase superfamily protein PhnB
MNHPVAEASVEVNVDPAAAFRIFTEEIDYWWVRGAINFFDASRATGMRIEPGVGGRVLEVYPDGALELARITVWQPGELLVYQGIVDDTEVEVRFAPVSGGTQVRVRQYPRPDADPRRSGPDAMFWTRILWMYGAWTPQRDRLPHRPVEVARVHVALYYADPVAAARWLADAFALTSPRARIPGEGERPGWIELRVGDVPILLFRLDQASPAPTAVTHAVWVFVDDLDAHFAHAKAAGASVVSEIHKHGFRAYEAEDPEGHRWTFAQARPTM